ncbi:hypothetical protein Bca52824_059602 [Brassica carinata]|uniref:Glutamyl-tRNA reductase N-terminal domain-containing protein n=1 Tax=Brassica carinata TaxID=52824 RepID=A0A8X7QW87_BRACI|nr:hypothetical protein Bca52824_059602 [Brassica carinata]
MAVSSAFVACPKLETLLNHHKLETPLGRALPSNNRSRRGLIQRARCELSASDSAPNAANISALEQLKNSAADRYTKERSSIVVIGLSIHTAPVEMREKLAIPEAEWPRAIAELCGLNHIEEAAVLSTCNRMEIYVLALSQHRGVKEVTEWMSKVCLFLLPCAFCGTLELSLLTEHK